MGWVIKTVELTSEQINLIMQTLVQRLADVDAVLKDKPSGLEGETERDYLLEKRDLNIILRELLHYATPASNPKKP